MRLLRWYGMDSWTIPRPPHELEFRITDTLMVRHESFLFIVISNTRSDLIYEKVTTLIYKFALADHGTDGRRCPSEFMADRTATSMMISPRSDQLLVLILMVFVTGTAFQCMTAMFDRMDDPDSLCLVTGIENAIIDGHIWPSRMYIPEEMNGSIFTDIHRGV
ncbi:uncharacterized protein CLUP02_09269 [Colletotrichum lupini]|uniref:Uncharacterized protein n=1 Tax=Colletotrichum lupini TaxID=145971 RepID=A0A9Q8SUP7_9PEZI|nr:uncharacterized protein CLUP02_09269 [Colletotrichum lupini]UQC83773.1 hypothetical protein CLUP02_09269 [Colletotrichum lupini]